MDTFDFIIVLCASIVLTVVVYLFVPVIVMLSGAKLKTKTIRIFVIINGIVGHLIFVYFRSIISGTLEVGNVAPAFLWSYVAYNILLKTSCVDGQTNQRKKQTENLKSNGMILKDGSNLQINNNTAKKCDLPRKLNVFSLKKLSNKSVKCNCGKPEKDKNNKFITVSNIIVIVLSIISMIAVFVAIIVQDPQRVNYENWNTATVYYVLLILVGVLLGVAIHSLIKVRYKLLSLLSLCLTVAAMIARVEGSVLSRSYEYHYSVAYQLYPGRYNFVPCSEYRFYDNVEMIDILNLVWFLGSVLICIVMFIQVLVAVVKIANEKWHKSVRYREKCYQRVAKMKVYLDEGIISEEEYERNKQEILGNIRI